MHACAIIAREKDIFAIWAYGSIFVFPMSFDFSALDRMSLILYVSSPASKIIHPGAYLEMPQ